MPFLTLQPLSVIRLNDTTTTPASPASSKYLSSYHSRRVLFPFQDEYDVPWQGYIVGKDSRFDPKFPVLTADIYDYDTLPFGDRPIPNQIFRQLANYKRKFFDYTNGTGFYLGVTQPIDDDLFLDHVFNAFYHQSFYRYAQFQMFKSTTELSTKPGFFIRNGLWGYFTSAAVSATYHQHLGDGLWTHYRNSARSSAVIWDARKMYDYVDWISETSTVNVFKTDPGWVGLNSWQNYRGWLNYACNNPNNHVDISSYYRQKIKEIEHGKAPISAANVMMASVVNELYENLTQINRHISRELSLLFDTLKDTDDPPPPELIENGYITITFSLSNCFGNISEKLGTTATINSKTKSYYPFRNPTEDWHNHNYVLTCEYGLTYDILDYERLLTVGREDNHGMPLIRSYNSKGKPNWCLATNPYDEFIDLNSAENRGRTPQTESKNNGRASFNGSTNTYHLSGDGLWLNALCLKTQTSAITAGSAVAYCPLSAVDAQRSGSDRVATAYAYWSESTYYNKGTHPQYRDKDGRLRDKFDIHTVSNIKSQPKSSIDIFNAKNPDFLSVSSSRPEDQEIYPRSACKQYFTHYMKTRIRAVFDKTYLPVFDKSVTEQMLRLRTDPIEVKFDAADIRALRTGIKYKVEDNGDIDSTGHIYPGANWDAINDDPYYMKYRHYYYNDSEQESADQVGSGTPPGSSYSGSSRPIWAVGQSEPGDYQWNKVYEALLAPEYEWCGDKFHFNLNQKYLNPRGEWFDLGIVGTVKDISFLLKTDIKLVSGYEFTSKVKCNFHGRGDGKYVVDSYNEPLEIYKPKNKPLRLTDDTYKVMIAGNTGQLPTEHQAYLHDNGSGYKYKFNNTDFIDKFRARVGGRKFDNVNDTWTTDVAKSAWNRLVSYLNDLAFPGCTDTKIYGNTPVDSGVDYVVWFRHFIKVPSNSPDHYINYNGSDKERFFLALRGFTFGINYENNTWN